MADESRPMDKDEYQSLVTGIINDAVEYVEGQLSPQRAEATDYYHGRPFGTEEEGRSQAVLTTLRDAVRGALPSLLRVIWGAERVVEFAPRTAERAEEAEQATDYVQQVFAENGGFLKTYSVLKDGLIKRIGAFRWAWEEPGVQHHKYTGLELPQLEQIAAEPGVTIVNVTEDASVQPPQYDVELTRETTEGGATVYAIPPEELLYTPGATSFEEATLVGHRTEKTRSELIELGISEDVIEEFGGPDRTITDNEEAIARLDDTSGLEANDEGEANEEITYVEAFIKVDKNGDGKTEMRRICTIGPQYHIVDDTIADERPFAPFCPDPEPHTIEGTSFFDLTKQLQYTSSHVLRAGLDSLSLAIFPRDAYVDGMVNLGDLMNTEIGSKVRMRAPGMVQSLNTPFVGKEAFGVLSYLDEVVERRTGMDKGVGLDADALQSTDPAAVQAAITASQEHKELIVRIFAEQTLKPLFRGLLRLFVKHQPRARTIRLRGRWVKVNPEAWDADMNVEVKVALGTSMIESRVQTLIAIAAKQEQILQMLGPDNPLVTLAQYRETLALIAQLKGFADPSKFFKVVDPNWQPPAPQQPQPTPEQVLAQAQMQIEQMRVQSELAMKQTELDLKQQSQAAELALKQQTSDRQHELELARIASDAELRRYEIELKYKTEITQKQFEQDMARTKLVIEEDARDADRELKREQANRQQPTGASE